MSLAVASNSYTAMWKKSVWKNNKIMETESEITDRSNKRNPDSKPGPNSKE